MTAIEIVKKIVESENPLEDDDFDAKDVYGPAYVVKYLVFTAGSGAYGSGGWSRSAKHRPKPQIVSVRTDDVVFRGKSVFVNGTRRLKCNVWYAGGEPVRIDYPDLKFI